MTKQITSTLRSLATMLGMILTILLIQPSVRADVQTWWGNGATANWSDPSGNWTNAELAASVPANGDYLIFANANQTSSSDDLSGLSVGAVTFTTGDFDLSGDLLTITGGITNSTGDNVFDLPLTLNGAQTFEIDASSLTFNQAITNNGNLTINGAGNMTWTDASVTNIPAKSLAGTGNLIVNGPGTVTVNGGFIYGTGITAPNFAGNTIVNGGMLIFNAGGFDGNSIMGQSLTINPGGAVQITAAHPPGASGRPFSIYGGSLDMEESAYFTSLTLSNATLTTLTGSSVSAWDLRTTSGSVITNLADSATGTSFGAILNLVNTATIGVALGTVNPAINFNSPTIAIEGAGSFTKTGLGTMLISSPDTHTGTTTISAGTLALSSTMNNTPLITVANNAVFDVSQGSFSLSANQTLAGSGTVVGPVYDNNAAGGEVLSPGGNNVVGTLTMGSLSLNGNAALNFDLANTTGIGGGTNDLLIVTNLTLASGITNTVNINFLNGTPLSGGTYTLIQYASGPAAGAVTTLSAVASRYTYSFFSDGNSIKVIVTGTPGNLVWKGDGLINAWDLNTTTNFLLNGAPSTFLSGDNTTFNDLGSNTPPVYVATAVSPSVLTVNANAKDYTFAGAGKITGGTSLIKSGSGNLTLLTANDFTGGGSLNGSGVVNVGNGGATGNLGSGNLTNNTKVTFFDNANTTYGGNMSGTGGLVSFMPGVTLYMTGTNTYTGGTTIANGNLMIGNNPAIAGSTVAGTITNYAQLYFSRLDAFTNINTVTSAGITREYGNGDVYVRGAGGMTVDGTAPISAGGSLNVGASFYGKLTINPGASIAVANTMNIGDSASVNGDVIQNGGTLSVNAFGTVKILSIGLYATEISTYSMFGGVMNVPNAMIDVGSDGIGLLTQTNGTINCTGLSIDNNGATAAIGGTNSTFTMTGGQLNIGVNGISGNTTTNALVHTVILSGGTIAATDPAGWSTVFNLWLTNGSPAFDTTNTTITLSGGLSGNGGLTKLGVGYLNLNNATNSYTGPTTVAAGTLQGTGTIVSPITVNSGANLSAGGTLATGTLTTSNVTVNAGGSVVIDASSTAATSDLLYVQGALALNNNPLQLNFLGGTPYTGGPYTILSNLVARTGSLVYNNSTRFAAALDQTQPNRVQISFTGTNASLVWQGNVSTNWNINIDANWLNAGVADKYYQSDAVTFDNTGLSQSNVNLSATVTPAKVTVDTTGNYTFAGSPIAGTATLTKSGSGTLTLVNSNSFNGLTTIAGGTLQVGNGSVSGALATNCVVDDYGSLVFNSPTPVNFNGTINGPGSLTQSGSGTLLITATQNHYGGTTIKSGSTVQLGNGPLADSGSLGNGTVTNNGTVIFNRAANVSVAAPYTGSGSFTFLGTGYGGTTGYILNGTNTFTGPVTLSLARIQSGVGAYSFGSPSSITVNPGSQVYAVATPYSSLYNIPLVLFGTGWADGLGALRIENGGTWAGPITLASNARIGVNNATTNIISGTISGNYELETYGGSATAALILSPSTANTYNALRVSIGTAGAKTIAGNANAIPNNIPLTMNGGTLQLNGYSKTFNPFYNLSSSSSLQNGSTTSPASVMLTPVQGSSSYSGTFADGGPWPLNVTFSQAPGLWTMSLTAASANWTGSLTNNGGIITNGVQNTGFGSQSVLGRSIVGNNGAVFVTTINNVFSGYYGNVVLNNSTWLCNRYISFAANAGYIYLANSTLSGTNNTDGTGYANMTMPSTVVVRGSAPSYMVGGGNALGYGLQASGTTFDVADATGDARSDLIVGNGSSTAFVHDMVNNTGCGLTKTGAGTLELDCANTYSGPTVISAGTLTLGTNGAGTAATLTKSPAISLASGAVFDVSRLAGGFTLNASQTLGGSGTVNGSLTDNTGTAIQPGGVGTAGTLTINSNLTLGGAGSLAIDLSNNAGSGNDKIVVGGTLTLASSGTPTPVSFSFLNGSPALGTPYTLIQVNGTISGTAATAFTNGPTRYVVTYGQTGNAVTVTFSGSASNLVWTGTDPLVPATWDVATSTNWSNGSGGDVFDQFDAVRFDDSSANTAVALNTTVTPQSIVVDTANTYAIAGTGAIAGNTGIIKTNTGTLTLSTVNTFTGPININEGKLTLGVNDALPPGVTVTVATNAVFDFTDNNGNTTTRGYNFIIGGAGPDGQGAMVDSVNGGGIFSYANVSNLTLTADSVIGGIERWDIGPLPNSKLDGRGHNLTIVGTGAIDIRPQIITNVNSITISNALTFYEYEANSQTNPWTTTITNYVMPGSALGFYGGQAINLPIVLTNATILNQGDGTPNWLSQITLQGTNEFNNSAAQVFSGVISGPGAMAVGGNATTAGTIPAVLTISNVNTFTGGVIISNAPVTKNAATAVGGYAALVLTSSNALGFGPITFDLSQMTTNAMTNVARVLECNLQGGGMIPNNIVLPALATGVTNVGIQGHDSSSVFTLSGQISGGFAGLTNWMDFGDASSFGVMRLANTANNFVGNIYGDRGVLAITGDGCLGNAANTLKLDQASVNGGLRFDAPGINVAHGIIVNSAASVDIYGDNTGAGIPATVNSATISGIISGAGAFTARCGVNVFPTSFGTLTLSGNNSFTAALTINPFVKVIAANANALGTTAGGTTVSASGTLSLNLGGTYASEPLTLTGGGVASGVGALENLSGNNVLNGTISLAAASTIGLTAGSLTLGGVISGAYPLTITGASPANTLTLSAAETYTAGTLVNGGTLLVNGSLPFGNVVNVASGAGLGGSGTINGPVTVQPGATLQPGGGGATVGKLVVNSTLNLAGNTVMYLNKSTPTNSQIAGMTAVVYGGTLTVNSLGGTYVAGDKFTLFSAGDHQGSFAAMNLPALAGGLVWSTNSLVVDGSIQVTSGVNTNPTNIVSSVSGGTLTLSWPADHTGWRLLVQTNNLFLGVSRNSNDWTTVSGSAATNSESLVIDPTKPAEFYELVYP